MFDTVGTILRPLRDSTDILVLSGYGGIEHLSHDLLFVRVTGAPGVSSDLTADEDGDAALTRLDREAAGVHGGGMVLDAADGERF